MTMKAYEYFQDFGRMGSLSGVFLADADDLEWFMGAEIWDHDILGKHSEIQVCFNSDTIRVLDGNESTVQYLHRVLGKNISGTTPYQYDYAIDEWREQHPLTLGGEDDE
jgi:hypothetical protein